MSNQSSPLKFIVRLALCTPLLTSLVSLTHAEIVGPYQPDSQTLHLWHMDEADAPVLDAVKTGTDLKGLGNGATLGNESYNKSKRFGTALCTYTGNPNLPPDGLGQSCYLSALPLVNGSEDNVSITYAGADGAFTYEALVRIDFNPELDFSTIDWADQPRRNVYMQIINADADENAGRVFQFRLAPIGMLNGNTTPLLEFINLNPAGIESLTATIPTSGLNAIRLQGWYHVAVTYNGHANQAGNLQFYWTALDATNTIANSIGANQMIHSLVDGASPDFAIGQTGRQSPASPTPNNNFAGLIDEVRISSVARSADSMMFTASTTVAKNETAKKPAAKPANKPVAKPEIKPEASATAADSTEPAVNTNATVTATPTVAPAEPAPAPVSVMWAKTGINGVQTLTSGVVLRGPQTQRQLALMFSCQDSDDSSVALLKALKSRHIKATFFVTSDFLSTPANLVLAQNILLDGHEIELQSEGWKGFGASRGTPVDNQDAENHLQKLVSLGVNLHDVRFILPDSAQLNSSLTDFANAHQFTLVVGTPGTLSMTGRTSEKSREFAPSKIIIESILNQEQLDKNGLNGYLMLFYFDSGIRETDKLASHFGDLLDALKKRDYKFVRLNEMLPATPPQ